jgi:hypothetical protein
MGILKLGLIVGLLAANGFVRSTGFFAAAHVCYPILVDILRSFSSTHSLLAPEKKLSNFKKLKSIFAICAISVVFLFPFGWIIKQNYSEYCKGTLAIDSTQKKFFTQNTCKNDFRTSLKFQTSIDFCPVLTPYLRIYDEQGEPSFCKEKIPNFYPWIQKRYWNVMFLSFAKLGQYENIIFMLLSGPIVFYFVYSQIQKILKAGLQTFGEKLKNQGIQKNEKIQKIGVI